MTPPPEQDHVMMPMIHVKSSGKVSSNQGGNIHRGTKPSIGQDFSNDTSINPVLPEVQARKNIIMSIYDNHSVLSQMKR